MKIGHKLAVALWLLATLSSELSTQAQGTAFTYQGRLNANGTVANGTYDLQFVLFDATTAGNPVGSGLTIKGVVVSNGLFNIALDFGSQFPGANRWLEIAARTNSGGAYSTLSPRQPITATPYAITAGNLNGAVASTSLTGTYANALTLNNAANQLAGNFTGNGAGVTNLNATELLSGTVPEARLSANVALRAGGNSFTGTQSLAGGKLSFGDANASIQFPVVSGASAPMITMFAAGTFNANRMVLAHSATYANWGLQYQDISDQFDFLAGGVSVMTVALGSRNVGIGTNAPGAKLDVNGTIRAGGGVIYPDGSIQTSAGAVPNGLLEFISSGSNSWTVPAGVGRILVDLWGGGGSAYNTSGGGGGGAYAHTVLTVTPGESLTVAVGGSLGTSSISRGGTVLVFAGGGGAGLNGLDCIGGLGGAGGSPDSSAMISRGGIPGGGGGATPLQPPFSGCLYSSGSGSSPTVTCPYNWAAGVGAKGSPFTSVSGNPGYALITY